ncbi:kinesin-like protein KIF20B isoform X2 [Antennarius striatus]|uniref:kinesin-like protein KIF20B isoform X2 n=1 Tax=Antennarius striatus TaxID=241820 RepID=UPI0035B2ECC1
MEAIRSSLKDASEEGRTPAEHLQTDPSPDPQHPSVEEKQHLQVYLRIRPLTSAENDNGELQDCVSIQPPDTVLLRPPSLCLSARLSTDRPLPHMGQRFQFSQVFGPQTTQKELFGGTVRNMVNDVLEGGNSLVFTYGVTNAGKTFTFLGPDADAGILPRSLDVIFSRIDNKVFSGMSIKPHRCREFTRLTREQQAEEAAFKRSLFRQLKESEKINTTLLNSTIKNVHEDSSMLGATAAAEETGGLEVDALTKFSVWVSFCEIYNENIHDLLEVAPGGALRRTILRLSQDVKGSAFVKGLRWVQVTSAEEAYMVMKLGKKNQSFSSTRLNQLSSRSHSIFSIRILRIEDVGTPRVHAVSELSLCDLAGSERCSKTQNKGERLKEAGNINTSLLILGKCINALRHNQQAKLLQHVPFRESKLTHYLQGFFCGRGKVCMIVNINQCSSAYDETLNVLKFSAVAQKVVVLSTRPLSVLHPERSSGGVSFINNTEKETLHNSRRSSLIGWDSSLEDVQESDEENNLMEDTLAETENEEDDDENNEKILVCKQTYQRQAALVKELQLQLKKEQTENLHMETQVREDVSREFSTLFSEMQNHYNECLVREREILEERAERRMEIFKDLTDKMSTAGPGSDTRDTVNIQMERAGPASLHLKSALMQLVEHDTEEKTSRDLMQKIQSVEQETQTSASFDGHTNQLTDAVDVGTILAEEDQTERMQTLEIELSRAKELLASKQLILEQQLKRLTETLLQQEEKSKREAEELRKKLHEQEESSRRQLEELRLKYEQREHSSKEEAQQLRIKREEQTKVLEKQVEELREKLQEQEMVSTQELEDLRDKLSKQETTCGDVSDVKKKLSEQTELLNTETEDAEDKDLNRTASEERLQRLNSVLQAEVESLKEKLSDLETTKELSNDAPRNSVESEGTVKEKSTEVQEEPSQPEERPPGREADLQEKLLEKETQISSLQKSLQRAQEQHSDKERQAVEDTRRREVERRRELLAVAHEAIHQKDEELRKKSQQIDGLQERAKQDQDTIRALTLDLQRNAEDTSDLKEKLADYKKQTHQVQTEISSMREEGKVLRQKLSDMEKAKKSLHSDVANRDKTIQQLKTEKSSNTKSDQTQLHQKACKDLEATQRVVEDMRLALMEQEETQSQMEQVLEEKLNLIQELSSEVETLKGMLLQQDRGHHQADSQSDDLKEDRMEAARVQETLRLCTEKQQAERKKWLEEKLSLLAQAKEAEDKRNQEMRKFVEDRERFSRQQSQLESLSAQIADKEGTMQRWRQERDALVSALEVQLQKLLSSLAEKDKLIQQLQQNDTQRPAETGGAGDGPADPLAAASEKEASNPPLEEQPEPPTGKKGDTIPQSENCENSAPLAGKPQIRTGNMKSGGKDTRASASSRGSGCPSVLDSSEISMENGRTSRFPQPELEISFSPLQPNRMALRRQGDDNAVTIKLNRSARKRKSGEMEKEEVEAQNRRNTRTKLTPKLSPHKELSSPAGCHDSQSSISSRKEGKLQKIGEFLQSSPTLLGTKAKTLMSLMSGRSDADTSASSSSLSLRANRSKKKLYRPEISSPLDFPSHPIISREPQQKESSHQIIKRRLRSRMAK